MAKKPRRYGVVESQRLGRLRLPGTWAPSTTSWQIVGTGNFTGNGEFGILWRNANGDTELWNANGSGRSTYDNLGVVSTNWSVHKIFA